MNKIIIKNSKFHNNGTAISVTKDTEMLLDNTELTENIVGIEVRESLTSLCSELEKEILKSKLDESSKKRLLDKILEVVNSGNSTKSSETAIKQKLKFVGTKAIDIFSQVVATLIARAV